jgi:hypothetical protein
MGTVTGALIVFFLFGSSATFRSVLFLPQDPAALRGSHVVLLAAYGLTFCYLASAPVLVLHALREALWPRTIEQGLVPYLQRWGFLLILPLSLAIGYLYFMPKSVAYAWKAGFVFVLAFVLTLQGVGIFRAFRNKAKALRKFYKDLTEARSQKKNVEFVESYRHLREHGNSFFIVFFELILGTILYVLVFADIDLGLPTSAENEVRHLVFIIFLWVLPAVGVWGIAQRLERSLLDGAR